MPWRRRQRQASHEGARPKGTALSADAIAEVVTRGQGRREGTAQEACCRPERGPGHGDREFCEGPEGNRTYSKWRVPCGFSPRYRSRVENYWYPEPGMGFSCKGLFRGLSSRMPCHLRGGWSPRP